MLSGRWTANETTTLQLGCWGFLELYLQPSKQVVRLAATHSDLLFEEQ